MQEAHQRKIEDTTTQLLELQKSQQKQVENLRSELKTLQGELNNSYSKPPDMPPDADIETNPNTKQEQTFSMTDLMNTIVPTIRETARADEQQSCAQYRKCTDNTSQSSKKSKYDKRIEKCKCDGDFNSDWTTHLDDFNDLCDDVGAEEHDKPRLLRLTLEKEARTFYNSRVRGKNITWNDIVRMFDTEYAGTAKRRIFSNQLRSLRYDQFKTPDRQDQEAIRLLCAKITALSTMEKPQDNTDEARADVLRTAVLGEDFATMAFGRVADEYNYATLKKALYQSLVDIQDTRKSASSSILNTRAHESDINFSQSRMRHGPAHHNSRHHRQHNYQSRPSRTIKCFNCEKEGCSIAICREPPDLQRIAKNLGEFRRNSPKYNSKRVNITTTPSSTKRALISQVLLAERILQENDQHDSTEDTTSKPTIDNDEGEPSSSSDEDSEKTF